MASEISSFVSKIFYQNTIVDGQKDSEKIKKEIRIKESQPFPGKTIVFCDTSDVEFPHLLVEPEGSHFNLYNAVISAIIGKIALKSSLDAGIITPYAFQSNIISKIIDNSSITVSTVHRFQGREKDIIIFDLVDNYAPIGRLLKGGYEEDGARLLNVAISRAKGKLVFVGNFKWLSKKTGNDDILKIILNELSKKAFFVKSLSFWQENKNYLPFAEIFSVREIPVDLKKEPIAFVEILFLFLICSPRIF